jgi:DeoR/GlpR family transcriptional regulator of sugar metabolism
MLKKTVIEKAAKVVMLMDNSKIGRSLPFTFASLSNIDMLICDTPLPADVAAELTAHGVECVVAEP